MATTTDESEDQKRIFSWISNLCCINLRGDSLRQLALRSSLNFEMGIILWHSFGAVAALLQEITTSYGAVLSGSLTWDDSNRLCWAITLIQSIAGHPETQLAFLRSDIMKFLLPILDVKVQTEPVKHVKMAVLGVFGGLVKTPSNQVISFLLESANVLSVVPEYLFLGSKLTKLITAYILRRVLEHDVALQYLYNNRKACFKLVYALFKVVKQLSLEPQSDPRIFENIVISYKRLAQDQFAKFVLQNGLMPDQLRKDFFCNNCVTGDQ